MKNQTIGGIAGIIEASLYIFGFIILFSAMQPFIDESIAAVEKLEFIIANKAIYQAWIILIYVVFGIVLIPLTIAIKENFENSGSLAAKSAPVFGFIWSGLVIASGMMGVIGIDAVATLFESDKNAALTAWTTIEAIQNGLGGGVEIIGGIWVFLISILGLKHAVFHRFLHYLGLIVGAAEILTIIPILKDFGAIFGIMQIFWFVWIGISMIIAKGKI